MWVVMQRRHRAVGNASPIMGSTAIGPFDTEGEAKRFSEDHYNDEFSYSVHVVVPAARRQKGDTA